MLAAADVPHKLASADVPEMLASADVSELLTVADVPELLTIAVVDVGAGLDAELKLLGGLSMCFALTPSA